jgi:predicted HTH transcriptional regulator
MRDRMLDHGLDAPILGTDSGYFQVTLIGPGEDIERLRTPEAVTSSSAGIASLNDRQKVILEHVVESGDVTTRWCMERFGVARDTAHRDLMDMVALRLLVPQGSGRSAKYTLGAANDE